MLSQVGGLDGRPDSTIFRQLDFVEQLGQKDKKTKWQKHQKTKNTFRQADSVERLGPCGWEEEAVANSGDPYSLKIHAENELF